MQLKKKFKLTKEVIGMNLLFRVMLTIYGVCLAVVSSIAAAIAINSKIFDNIVEYMDKHILESDHARILLFAFALIFLVISLVFLLSGFKSNKDKKSISKYTNIGEIKISLNAIESIALSASRKLNGIRETKAYVSKMADGVSINIKVVIFGDVNVPILSEDIQVKVKNSVEETTGIKVNDVRVTVENIHTGYKTSRVE
jgi:uncharacterized alkaline shock family protein YloU